MHAIIEINSSKGIKQFLCKNFLWAREHLMYSQTE